MRFKLFDILIESLTVSTFTFHIIHIHVKCQLRYDFIDTPGMLGNYVPVNYYCLYDFSVLVDRMYTQGTKMYGR